MKPVPGGTTDSVSVVCSHRPQLVPGLWTQTPEAEEMETADTTQGSPLFKECHNLLFSEILNTQFLTGGPGC